MLINGKWGPWGSESWMCLDGVEVHPVLYTWETFALLVQLVGAKLVILSTY